MKNTIDSFDEMKEEYIKIQDKRIQDLKRIIETLEKTIEQHKEEIKNQDDVIKHFRQRMHMLEHEIAKRSQQTGGIQ